MRRSRLWIGLFVMIAAVELFTRFALPFDLHRVLVVEAVLFVASGFAGYAISARPPQAVGWRHGLKLAVAAAFVLAAIRSGLWAAGQPIARANLVIALLGALILAAGWRQRRRAAPISGSSS